VVPTGVSQGGAKDSPSYPISIDIRSIFMVTRLNFEKGAIFVLKISQNSYIWNFAYFEQKIYCKKISFVKSKHNNFK